MMSFEELQPSALFIIEGSLVTLQYSIMSVIFGLMLGVILSLFKISKNRALNIIASIYTSIFRGTPLLIQLSIIYFALPGILGVKIGIFTSGVIAFSMNSGAYVSEIIRAGINAVDKGQWEAAKALGVPYISMMRDIILPQAIRKILPSLVNELVNMIKESAIISMLGGMDLMRRAQIIAAEQYTYFTPMLIAASCYYVMIFILVRLAKILEKKLAI